MWNLPHPPGFQGIHPEKPLTVYYRHLPHWRQEGATYFVTFRLADSLPQSKLNELKALRQELETRQAQLSVQNARPTAVYHRTAVLSRPRSARQPSRRPDWNSAEESIAHQMQERIEQWLDQGMGRCLLRRTGFAAIVTTAMHHFDDDRYELGCYSVMPNHVHAIVRPHRPSSHSLEGIVGSWKKYCALRINRLVEDRGSLWQEETFDRIIRDEEHLWRAIQYIGANPAKAGLAPGACPVWIRPQWLALGWKFDVE